MSDGGAVRALDALDARLREACASDPPSLDWDDLAARTLVAAEKRRGEPPDPALFEPPLPAAEGEPLEFAETVNASRVAEEPMDPPPASLAEIAREAVHRDRTERLELARETFGVAARARAAAPPAAHDGLRRARGSDPPAATVRSESLGALPSPEQDHRPRVVELTQPPRVSAGRRRGAVATAGLLVAAALALYIGSRVVSPAASSSVAIHPPPSTVEARSETPSPESAHSSESASDRAEADEPPAPVALGELPLDVEAAPATAPGAAPRASTRAPEPLEQPPPPPSEAEAPASPRPASPAMRPAAQSLDLPQRPSVGTVQAAIASVMQNAQRCLAGQDDGAPTSVTFGSDGRVQSVKVSGPAAGTLAEGCVAGALGRARVGPFAEPSYTARVTVRPP
jgi:hypothetical protein